jgi:hypothetical protein
MESNFQTYYQKNRERSLAYANAYYRDHRQERNKKAKKYYQEHRAELLLYHKEYGPAYKKKNAQKIREYYREWYRKNGRLRTESDIEKILEWRQQNPEKARIQQQLRTHVASGEFKRPTSCPRCGTKARVQAHHTDYEHYSHFVWLCASCHKLEHNKLALDKLS